MPEQTATQDKQFTITRVFDAPRELVWQAWTDPDEAAIWWHPRGIETPRESVQIDARVGGQYSYTMIAPDGTEYPTTGDYREITPPERLVFTWGSPGRRRRHRAGDQHRPRRPRRRRVADPDDLPPAGHRRPPGTRTSTTAGTRRSTSSIEHLPDLIQG